MKPSEGSLEEVWKAIASRFPQLPVEQMEEMKKAFFLGVLATADENLRLKFIDRSGLLLKRKKECLEFFTLLGIKFKDGVNVS